MEQDNIQMVGILLRGGADPGKVKFFYIKLKVKSTQLIIVLFWKYLKYSIHIFYRTLWVQGTPNHSLNDNTGWLLIIFSI